MGPWLVSAASASRAAAKGDGVIGYLIKCPVQENGKGRKASEAFASIVFHNPP